APVRRGPSHQARATAARADPRPKAREVTWTIHDSQTLLGRTTRDMGRRDPVRMLVIDAANVIGSRRTGWWRDRPGAARVFTERVRATVIAGRLDQPVTIVLEGRA